jgi:hypothetical protein
MKTSLILFLVGGSILVGNLYAADGFVTSDEMIWKDEWVRANLPKAPAKESAPAVIVVRNLGGVTKDARGRESLRIDQTEYRRGLFCHANSLLIGRPNPPRREPGQELAFAALMASDVPKVCRVLIVRPPGGVRPPRAPAERHREGPGTTQE